MPITAHRLRDVTLDQLVHGRALDLVRWVQCLVETEGRPITAAKVFVERFPRSLSVDLVKAAIAPGMTSDSYWGAPLLPTPLTDGIIQLVRASSLIGKLQLRRVPFYAAPAVETTSAGFSWVGENKVKPLSEMAFAPLAVPRAKASGQVVLAAELARSVLPGVDAALRDGLRGSVHVSVGEQVFFRREGIFAAEALRKLPGREATRQSVRPRARQTAAVSWM